MIISINVIIVITQISRSTKRDLLTRTMTPTDKSTNLTMVITLISSRTYLCARGDACAHFNACCRLSEEEEEVVVVGRTFAISAWQVALVFLLFVLFLQRVANGAGIPIPNPIPITCIIRINLTKWFLYTGLAPGTLVCVSRSLCTCTSVSRSL